MSMFRWGFEALCINEYVGLTFDCPAGEACLGTGRQVLKTLSFGGHTVRYPVFGLGMVLLSFVALGYLILYLVQIKFVPLGYQGSTFTSKGNKNAGISPSASGSLHNNAQKVSPQQQAAEVEMVPKPGAGGQVVEMAPNSTLVDMAPSGAGAGAGVGIGNNSHRGYSVVRTSEEAAQEV
jgi:hypothetical protein